MHFLKNIYTTFPRFLIGSCVVILIPILMILTLSEEESASVTATELGIMKSAFTYGILVIHILLTLSYILKKNGNNDTKNSKR